MSITTSFIFFVFSNLPMRSEDFSVQIQKHKKVWIWKNQVFAVAGIWRACLYFFLKIFLRVSPQSKMQFYKCDFRPQVCFIGCAKFSISNLRKTTCLVNCKNRWLSEINSKCTISFEWCSLSPHTLFNEVSCFSFSLFCGYETLKLATV